MSAPAQKMTNSVSRLASAQLRCLSEIAERAPVSPAMGAVVAGKRNAVPNFPSPRVMHPPAPAVQRVAFRANTSPVFRTMSLPEPLPNKTAQVAAAVLKPGVFPGNSGLPATTAGSRTVAGYATETASGRIKALHMGAGNIGRGFIGKLLSEGKCDVIFADVVPELITNLHEKKRFKVRVVGEHERTDEVEICDAFFSNSEDALKALIDCDLMTTAVGPRILERIAPSLLKALTERKRLGIERPIHIIACENMLKGSSLLKSFVIKDADPEMVDWIEGHAGFVDCAVDRIVPPPDPHVPKTDPLDVTVEEFCEWVVDRTQFIGEPPAIHGMQPVDNLMAFVERKLMTVNTGHAICAYLGYIKGHEDIRSSILDPSIRKVVVGAMRESGDVLIERYGLNKIDHYAYIDKIIKRYENPYLRDEVTRVGREPGRKLAPEDRLIKPLKGAIEFGFSHKNLVTGVAAALLYDFMEDPQAVSLQKSIENEGIARALAKMSQLDISSPVMGEIVLSYDELRTLKKSKVLSV